MLPHQGQGASQALEDAEALGVFLATATAETAPQALKDVFRVRYKRATQAQEYSRTSGMGEMRRKQLGLSEEQQVPQLNAMQFRGFMFGESKDAKGYRFTALTSRLSFRLLWCREVAKGTSRVYLECVKGRRRAARVWWAVSMTSFGEGIYQFNQLFNQGLESTCRLPRFLQLPYRLAPSLITRCTYTTSSCSASSACRNGDEVSSSVRIG